MFTTAIVRPPGPGFADGLTEANLGPPDLDRALEQHAAYCRALERCGLTLHVLPPDPAFPDSTFVEDTAFLRKDRAILTRPGAPSRQGEVEQIRKPLSTYFESVAGIKPPGTLDAGDICDTGETVFVGLSRRTNEEGIRQLSALLSREAEVVSIDIRGIPSLLHLKSGLSSVGSGRLTVSHRLEGITFPKRFDLVQVADHEEYAANNLLINQFLLLPSGFPQLESVLSGLGYQILLVDMSEFQKMDGGLSCLSLRF
ncbi:MAG: arginine deiminase family protein [Ignavibacteria bacterium]|nr:arginine deiminase family protein [Ignavibacteria bacterium]